MSRARTLSLLANENALSVNADTLNVGVANTLPGTTKFAVGAAVTMDGTAGIITAVSFVGDGALIRNVPANRVGGATSVGFDDGIGAYWGGDEDLGIYHNGSHSIVENKTGDLQLRSDHIDFWSGDGSERIFESTKDESVKLFYNGNSKIETTNTGAVVTGILTATTNAKVGDHIALDHAATGGTVSATHFSGNITGTAATFTTVSVAGTITHEDVTNVDSVGIVTAGAGFRATTGGIQITAGIATFKSGVDLQLEGDAAGITSVTWDASAKSLIFKDNAKAVFGDSSDFDIYHDGTNSNIINSTGDLYLQTGASKAIYIRPNNGENGITLHPDGAVDLYYDAAKKLETTTAGVVITGICTAQVPNAPQNSQGSSYTLVKSDAGKHIYSSDSIECPANVFAAGDMITIYNNSGSNKSITQGTSLTMYLSDGEGNSGTRTLKQRCVCTVLYTSTTESVISGGGLE